MQTLIILRAEIISLAIILYLQAYNLLYGSQQQRKTFALMASFGAGHVIFDMLSVITVNMHTAKYLNTEPNVVNHVCHVFFYLFGTLFAIEFLIYVLNLIYPNRKKLSIKRSSCYYAAFTVLYIIVFYFLPIHYTHGNGTNYSGGFAASAAFAIPLLLFAGTTVLLIINAKHIDRGVLVALLPMLGIMFAAEITEIFWTEILITGGAITMVMVGTYFSLENPRLFRALRQAEASDRAKSFFLASMSHELRTPLNAVIGFSELLRDDPANKTVHHDYLDGIANSGKALLEMVNDLLDLSKLESGEMTFTPVETDIDDLMKEIGGIFSQQCEDKQLKLIYEIGAMPLVAIDKLRLRQILFNLGSNAIKFTRSGSVTLRAHFHEDTKLFGTLQLSVQDTGVGISKDDQKTIFQPFIQSKAMRGTYAANKGTGLGLAIVQRMVRQMGGDIVLDSKPGKGSNFIVVLPHLRYTQRVAVETVEEQAAATTNSLKMRVLLVDDIRMNLKVTEAMCRKLGITDIQTAQSGIEALALADRHTFDLVLTDLWMPDINGLELAHEMRKKPNCKHIPIIALTADIEASSNFSRDAFDGILLKPVTIAGLRATLDKINAKS